MVKFLTAAAWTQGIVHRSTVIVASFVVALVAASLGMLGTAAAQSLSPELAKTRAALEKYQDPLAAVRDGYFSTVGCVHYANGGMGVHFLNVGLISPTPDPLKPQILVYEQDGTKLRLVAAEWFVPLATGVKERPTLFGQPFDGPMEGHEPLMPADLHHYDLHVWLFKDNPLGMFEPVNPDVTCEGADFSLLEGPTKLVPGP